MSALDATMTGIDDTWTWIDAVERMPAFLVSVLSNEDHWLFAASNGGLTAGRGTPDLALFPYVTQDKLIDTAGTTGPLTRVRVLRGGEPAALWRPFDGGTRHHPRRLARRLDGTRLRFEETAPELDLVLRYTWGFSRRFGFVRRCELHNQRREAVDLDLLDGLQNLQPCGVDASFQNQYSVLVDAYKRVECLPDTGLRLVYLSSVPTDRAEPSESLRGSVAWSTGLPSPIRLVSTRQLVSFEDGAPLAPEDEARGQRAACLDVCRLRLLPGETRVWYTVAETGLSTADVTVLQRFLSEHDPDALAAVLEAELSATSEGLRRMVGSADGLQCSQDRLRQARHRSNVSFNIMRGGIFLDGDHVPVPALEASLRHFNRPLAQRHAAWLAELPPSIRTDELQAQAEQQGDPDLVRLCSELLPLTFSRRHGDPSRPWNRFSIKVRDRWGEPRLSYEGNWRDIFQNWEALSCSYPSFIEGMVTRFLNASTADGYNPYRLTSEGFDWETVDPHEPWSNIGYWGDHQIIYLLRLLEVSRRYHPGRLEARLDQPVYAYANVPYRIAPYADILRNPRVTIHYDHPAAAQIADRVEAMGADGQLLVGPDGEVLHVSLLEKLLTPLLAKISNFVPGGGIWMNTQRPEWNDANNALVGFGVSVVTLGACHRYVQFLLDWWEEQPAERAFSLSAEVVTLLKAQAEVVQGGLAELGDDHRRRACLDALGQSATTYREGLYGSGLSGRKAELSMAALRTWLRAVRAALAASLRANQRPDGLFHSYNLLRVKADGGVELQRLPEMLEGQVAVLSAGLLSPREALHLASALRDSPLYRPDQDSYLLYPDRDLPRFLEKNRIPAEDAARLPLLARLAADQGRAGGEPLVQADVDGALRFGGHLRNGEAVRKGLAALPPDWQADVLAQGPALVALFERIFDHHRFTGRSGTFFAYEGLGSIYWHMVSKLVLAVQEQALATSSEADPELAGALARAYHAAQAGLGLHKRPAHYGAFPTDAYSHTPRHAGAQQPGMTGQVKEDILIRWGELGVQVRQGRLSFRPRLLRASELLASRRTWSWIDVNGQEQQLDLPAGTLAFTVCQVPVIYRTGETAGLRLVRSGPPDTRSSSTELSEETSAEVFRRTGTVRRIEVDLPAAWLLSEAD